MSKAASKVGKRPGTALPDLTKPKKPDIRHLMRKEKQGKIDSPLAKYTASGQLICVLCNTTVKGDLVWTAHINGKAHRDNLQALKKSKEEPAQSSNAATKRDAPSDEAAGGNSMPPPSAPPAKKQKTTKNPPGALPGNFFDQKPKKGILKGGRTDYKVEAPSVAAMRSPTVETDEGVDVEEPMDQDDPSPSSSSNPQDPLPEGFFDDPVADARVRQVEYRDPGEEEWERFQREIKEASSISARIVEEERAEASAERQLEEIDDQIRHWSRVIEVERRKEELRRAAAEAAAAEDDSDSDAEDLDGDEFLDWRAKRA